MNINTDKPVTIHNHPKPEKYFWIGFYGTLGVACAACITAIVICIVKQIATQ